MDRSRTDEPVAEGEAHRCSCGSLLARLVAGGVELKCRRCKAIVVLPLIPAPKDVRGVRG